MGFGRNNNNNNNEAGSSSHSIPIAREDTPLLGKSKQSSKFKSFANIFIAVVGSGVLGLPYTYMRSGWLVGVLVLFSIALLSYYCMLLLVATRRKLESLNGCAKINSFGDLGSAVCGTLGRFAVDLMIILSQAGFCVSYLIFISNTLAHLFNNNSTNLSSSGSGFALSAFLGVSPKKWYLWGSVPFQLGLNSIPTLTHLAPLSIFADVVQIGSMGVVMGKEGIVFAETRPEVRAFGGWGMLLYCIGVCAYAFEGIGMVLPLESEARDKKSFGKILGASMGLISVLYGLFGVMGYLAYGDETRDIITTNIGSGFISVVVQIGLCINLFFSFPLMMNPVFEVLERRCNEGRYSLWIRWLTVLGVALIATLVPNFADFLSLVGSSVCIALGFVFPSLFHLIVFKDELPWPKLGFDFMIIVVGVVLAVSGTWSTLQEILATKA